jgi:mono/diheme cytochrome c family protein
VRLRHLALAAAAALAAGTARAARAAEGGDAAVLARGEAVARRFCGSCHGARAAGGPGPLADRLRPEAWPDAAQAYLNLGQLWRVNGAMTFAFEGPDEERRALAAYLAVAAQRQRPGRWERVLPALGLAAVVAAAAAWARRRVRASRRG